MKIGKFFIFLSFMLSLVFSFIEDYLESEYTKNSKDDIEDYSALSYLHDNILEEAIDPNEYYVGPGDEFKFTMIYPQGVMSLTLSVSPVGDILIPLIGSIDINDMKLVDVFNLVKSKCLDKYEASEVNLTLSKIRKFKIRLIGAIKVPGYVVASPTNRVADVLIDKLFVKDDLVTDSDSLLNIDKRDKTDKDDNKLTNAFSDSISVHNNKYSTLRNLLIIREGKEISVDLTKFHRNGNNINNPRLKAGDIIKVPYVKHHITISGAVNKQGEYEFRPDESLYEFLELVSGFTDDADTNKISITRSISRDQRESHTFNSLEATKTFPLEPEDHIYVGYDPNYRKQNFVDIYGEINFRGRHALHKEGMRVRDIIQLAGGYTADADLEQIIINNQEISRLEDKELERVNALNVYNLSDLDKAYIKARGALDKGMILSNNKEYTENILDFKINDGDHIIIPKRYSYVEVIGAVKSPGRYPIRDSYSVSDYIRYSGGKLESASPKVYIINSSTGQRVKVNSSVIISSGDVIFVAEKKEHDKLQRTKDVVNLLYQILVSLLTLDRLLTEE